MSVVTTGLIYLHILLNRERHLDTSFNVPQFNYKALLCLENWRKSGQMRPQRLSGTLNAITANIEIHPLTGPSEKLLKLEL